MSERRLLSIVTQERLRRVLKVMLDENEFFSPFGIRALSRVAPGEALHAGDRWTGAQVDYEPAESTTALFGGNSNWRGPIWFPVNFLLVESLQKFHHYLGDDFTVECPTGSGQMMTLWEVAAEMSRRLARPFLKDANGRRPVSWRRHEIPATIRTGATWCCSTSISTATTAAASAPAIRQDGPGSSPSCFSKAASA